MDDTPIDWDKLATNATTLTDKEFETNLAKLTNLKIMEIDNFIAQSDIDKNDILKVLQEINNVAKSNNEKADTIVKIKNGVEFLVSLTSRIIKIGT